MRLGSVRYGSVWYKTVQRILSSASGFLEVCSGWAVSAKGLAGQGFDNATADPVLRYAR